MTGTVANRTRLRGRPQRCCRGSDSRPMKGGMDLITNNENNQPDKTQARGRVGRDGWVTRYLPLLPLFLTVMVYVSWVAYRAISYLPWGSYIRGSPRSLARCELVRPGMRQEEILRIMHEDIPPPEEELEGRHEMVFAWESGACVVEVEPTTGLAASARIDLTRPAVTFSWLDE